MPVTFSESSTATFPQPGAGGRMTFIDADGDGDLDILYQTVGNGTAFQYARSNGDGTYTIFALASSPFAGISLPDHNGGNYHVGDIDGDGDMDLWAGQATGAGTGLYLRNDGGTFTSQSSATFPAPLAASRSVMGDFDNDGDADILYQTAGNGTAFQYARSNGDGTYTILSQASSPFAGVTLLDNGGGTHFAGDFDGDGDLDVYATAAGATGGFYRNDGGVFTSQSTATFPAALAITRYVVGDFDSDGDDDILYQTGADGTPWQYARSNADGTFTILSQGDSPFAGVSLVNHNGSNFVAADVDGDGDDDLVGTSNGTTGEFYLASGKPPEIASSTPSDNGTGVAVGANITLTFDESVSKGSGNIYLYRGDGVLIETISVGSAQVTGSGTTWTIDPSVTLAGLTNYYVLTDDGIFVDADGSIFFGVEDSTTLNFTTAASNTAPTFTNLNGDSATFTEGTAQRLDVAGNAIVSDAEQANFNGGTLTVAITGGEVSAQDVLGVANIGAGAGQIGVSGASITYQGVVIGTFTGGAGGASLVISLDGDATVAATQALVRALQYNNTSDAPDTGARTVTVTLTDGAGGTSAVQSVTVGITPANDLHTGGVSVTGTATENQVLTADASTLADVDGLGTLHYQWQRDTGAGFVNVGVDQATYTLGDADVGGLVRVVAYYTDAGGTVESATSAATAAIAGVNDPHTGGASITGAATEDQILTAVSTLADADGLGTLHYQWQRDTGSGFVNVGADEATYTLGDSDVGGVVRVVISYTDGQGFAESATSASTAAIANVNDVPSGGVSVTGTVAEDQVLTADTSTLADGDGLGTLHYQWQRDTGSGFVNVGADQATYTLGEADVGGVIRVVTSYVDQRGTAEAVTSAATGVVANVDDAAVAGDDTDTVNESAVVSGSVFGNDTDSDGPALAVSEVNGSAASVGVQITLASGALLTLNADGTYSYDPNGAFVLAGPASGASNTSATDSFTYTLVNGGTATVTITINGENDPDDPLAGGGGDDILGRGPGVAGANPMNGGTGSDFYFVDNVGDAITDTGGATDRVFAGVDYVLAPGVGIEILSTTDHLGTAPVNLTGNGFGQRVQGNEGANRLDGGGGDDLLVGGGGGDILIGGTGADVLSGGADDDFYFVDGGGDVVVEAGGQGVNDRVFSGTSFVLTGGAEIEVLSTDNHAGTAAIDLTGNELNNLVHGNEGANRLDGGAGDDFVVGGGGADVLLGRAGQDVLNGGAGDDSLLGGLGADTMIGGSGDDIYFVDDAGDVIIEGPGQGADRAFASASYTLAAGVEVEVLSTDNDAGTAAIDLTGNAFGQRIQGNEGANTLNGGGGADALVGGGGVDSLFGGAGGDVLNGGDGADTLSGGQGDDQIAGGLDFDTVLLTGLQADYTVQSLGGGAWRITDNVGGRDGVDLLTGVEQLQFSDGFVVLGAASPALTGKDAVEAQTLPGLDNPDPLDGLLPDRLDVAPAPDGMLAVGWGGELVRGDYAGPAVAHSDWMV